MDSMAMIFVRMQAIVLECANSVSTYASQQWSELRNVPLSRRDKIVLSLCIFVVGAGAVLGLVSDIPAQAIQVHLMSLILAAYIVGFCDTTRARFWSLVFLLVNVVLWFRETSAISRAISGAS